MRVVSRILNKNWSFAGRLNMAGVQVGHYLHGQNARSIVSFGSAFLFHGTDGSRLSAVGWNGAWAELKADGEPGPGCRRIGAGVDER